MFEAVSQKMGLGLFTNSLNAERMVKIYEQGLLPSVKKFFKIRNNQLILQKDNGSNQRSRLCRRMGIKKY